MTRIRLATPPLLSAWKLRSPLLTLPLLSVMIRFPDSHQVRMFPLCFCPCSPQTCPRPSQTCPRLFRTCPCPPQTCPCPLQTCPRPSQTCPRPSQTCPRPFQTCPRPSQTCPRPPRLWPSPPQLFPLQLSPHLRHAQMRNTLRNKAESTSVLQIQLQAVFFSGLT